MNNLIINGIDHSNFDIEWAKRGGVLSLKSHLCKMTYFCTISGLITVANILAQKTFNSESHASVEQDVLRMATPNECAEAGIEYIEPPARWLPINTLTTDIPVPLIVCDKKSKERGVLTGENIFGGACISGWNDDNITPTHWMPLPRLPKDE